MFDAGVKETLCTRCAHREVCTYKQDYLDIQISQAIALVNRNHRRKKYDTERLSAGSSSHSPRRFTA